MFLGMIEGVVCCYAIIELVENNPVVSASYFLLE